MSYSFDSRPNRWAELEEHYTSMIDELNESKDEDSFLAVDDFDELEIL